MQPRPRAETGEAGGTETSGVHVGRVARIATTSRPRVPDLDSRRRVCDRGGVARVGALAEQMRRAVREPRVSPPALQQRPRGGARIVEPDDAGVLAQLFGVGRDVHDRLRPTSSRRDVRRGDRPAPSGRSGTPLRLFGRRERATTPTHGAGLLYGCVRLLRPRAIVETGVFDGVSTSVILKALADNGAAGGSCRSTCRRARRFRASTDKMAVDDAADRTAAGLARPRRAPRSDGRFGRARRASCCLLRRFRGSACSTRSFTTACTTAEHMTWEWDVVWPALAAGGLLLSDDVFWSTAFWRFCRRRRVHGLVARGMGLVRRPPF